MFKAANNYDIYDPETGHMIVECREEGLGIFSRILRFTDFKRMTPFDIQIRTPDGQPIVRITTLPSGQKSHRFNHLELASQESCKELS